MMANQPNSKPPAPWPTSPQQMPWKPFYEPHSTPLPFGQSNSSNSSVNDLTQRHIGLNSTVLPETGIPSDCQFTSVRPSFRLNCNSTLETNNPFNPVHQAQLNPTYVVSDTINVPSHFASDVNISSSSLNLDLIQPAINAFHSDLDDPTTKSHHPSDSVTYDVPVQQKRTSFEMEDENMKGDEPPTKQQLSENKLFKRFGSLHLENECFNDLGLNDNDSSSSDDSDSDNLNPRDSYNRTRREFDRYVYLLFKDKGNTSTFNRTSQTAIDRLLKSEREKLSKAVVLWNPPLKHSIFGHATDDNADSDDDEFSYTDHRDFLRKPNEDLVITEIVDEDAIITDETNAPARVDEDVMID